MKTLKARINSYRLSIFCIMPTTYTMIKEKSNLQQGKTIKANDKLNILPLNS